jgi:hypothetical protein
LKATGGIGLEAQLLGEPGGWREERIFFPSIAGSKRSREGFKTGKGDFNSLVVFVGIW